MKFSSDKARGLSLLAARFAPLALLLGLAQTGCQSGAPGLPAYPASSSVSNISRVDEFPTGSANINPNLFENNNPPTYTLRSPGTIQMVNNFPLYCGGTGFVVAGGVVSPYCFRMSGAVTEKLDNQFPALDLEVPIENYTFYDANHFNGVRFYMKVANDDTAFHRIFAIPVAQTVPNGTNNGLCPAGPKQCYDHFAADYSGGTGGGWILSSYNFSDLTQQQSGYAPQPYATLTGGDGFNLKQVLWLQWEEGNNNKVKAVANIDLYVDDIEFF